MDPLRDPAMREALRRQREIEALINSATGGALRHQREIEALINSATGGALRRQREIEALINSATGGALRHQRVIMNLPHDLAMREVMRHARDLHSNAFISSPAFNATRDFLMQNDVARRIINSPEWRVALEAQWRQRDLLAITNLTVARAIPEVNQFIINNRHFGYFPQSFAAEILSTLLKIEEPTDEQSLQNFIDGLEALKALVINKCKELATDPATYWGMVKFIFTIFAFLYPLYENQQFEKRVIDSVNQTGTEILKEVEKLKPAEVKGVYYVVVREAKLKSHPRPKSATIQILPPNQLVKLVRAKGKWIYVEYFDHIEGVPKTGWVLKKYTKRLGNYRVEVRVPNKETLAAMKEAEHPEKLPAYESVDDLFADVGL